MMKRGPRRAAPPPPARCYSGAPWEGEVGYCRAVRAGGHVYVSGTAPIAEGGGVVAPGDAYAQAPRCLEIIERALKNLGGERAAIVRTRMFVTDISRWAEFGRAHREFFGRGVPAATMVEVRRLVDPDMLIEIEADAVIGGDEACATAARRARRASSRAAPVSRL